MFCLRPALLWLPFAVWGWSSLARAEEPVTITVQGDKRPEGELANEPYVASSRVTRERLAAPGVRVPDVLRGEAGVQIAESGGLGAPATASIRGATAAQTPVYLGGVRLNDQVGGVVDLSTIPLWLVERVELYRGNAPFEADELGIGGAVFFEPRRPKQREAAAGVTFGSFGTRAGFGYFSVGDDDAGVLVGLSGERADNDYEFTDNRGTLFQTSDDARRARSNADTRLRDAWVLGRARPSDRVRLDFTLNNVAREQGVPKLALVPSRSARAELSRTLAAVTARLGLGPAGRNLLTLRTSLLDGATQLHDPERELGTLTAETELHGRRVEQRAALDLPLGARLRFALSTDGSAETLARRDGSATTAAKATTLGSVARLEWKFWREATLVGVLGAQCRSTQPGDRGCAHFEPTGRIGAGYRGDGYTLFANVSRYQRMPTLGELYGAAVLVRGNTALRPELGLSADVGARGLLRVGSWSLHGEATGFVRSADDLVSYARAAQGYVVPVNVGHARVAGLELGVGARAFGHLELGCNLSLLDPRDTTPDRRLQNDFLPFMSRLVLAPRVLLTTGELEGDTLKRADLGADLSYLSNRFADPAGLVVIPEQTTLGVTGAASWLSGVLVSRVRVANATGAQRFDIVGYPLPGRSVYASLEVHTP
ncbi:MAG TPA: TonB-dependent receptor [Polyangiaceae bacterium]|nr:TonB-dependent receptor [Polyangiaceae bacterium]